MPLRVCDFDSCNDPAERNRGSCMICAAHLCLKHMKTPFHLCPQESSEPDQYYERIRAADRKHNATLFDRINFVALKKIAQTMRGIKCELPSFDNRDAKHELLSSQMGGQNCHIDIKFADGVTWIARIRLCHPFIPPDLVRDCIANGEVAVLKFLETTQVPAPRVYHHTVSSALDEVGVPYILMEKLPGQQLDWNNVDESNKTKILHQLADIYIELRKHPFNHQGSLMLTVTADDSCVDIGVGPYALVHAFVEPTMSLGPYKTTHEAAKDFLSAYLDRYSSGELDDFAVDTYLTHKWRLELIDRLYEPCDVEDACKFYLRHCDDKGDHILIDENFNITGIIDWEWASVECEEIAFGSPCMLWPVGPFCDGHNDLSADEDSFAAIFDAKGAANLAKLIRSGRLHQRLWFFTGGASYEHATLVAMFDALRDLAHERFGEPHSGLVPFETWREQMLQGATGIDPRLAKILGRQQSSINQE